MTDLTPLLAEAEELVRACRDRGLRLATAESCTGGLIAAALTEIAGSSAVLDCGFVTYSDEAKTAMLGVDAGLIRDVGAVSEAVAVAMAEGALTHSTADIAVAVTGIAGPGGGSAEKPVGLVHFCAIRRDGKPHKVTHAFEDLGRSSIRTASVRQAMRLVRELVATGK